MKTTYELAIEVLDGKWGSGDARKNALTKAGYDYEAVQKKVNEIVDLHNAICDAAKAQVSWSKDSVYKWQSKPNIVKSKTHGTCVTYVACVLQRIGVLKSGEYVWTNGTGFGNGKVLGANDRMIVTYYNNKKSVKDLKKILQVGDILIFDDNKSGKVGDCGHICIYNGKTYYNGIHTFTGGHNISVNGKEKYTRKVLAVVRIKSMPKRKTVDELAHEVLDGKWGSGDKRKDNLINAGYDYDKVQARVNELVETKKQYEGEMPTLKLIKTNGEVITDAIRFAKWIVNDNRFGYGRKGGAKYKGTKEYEITHSGGCHFCGSNAGKISRAKKAGLANPEEWEYTYVCNTLVCACYAHAGVMSMLKARGHAWWTSKFQDSKDWQEIKKPAKLTDLKAGDVLGSEGHYCLYLGNGKGAEATSEGDAGASKSAWAKSIHICDFSARFKSAIHIFRYVGTVNSTALIRYGEISERVKLLQKYLKWYGYDIDIDGIFGEKTYNAVKDMQKGLGVTDDGIVGAKTLTAMKEYRK